MAATNTHTFQAPKGTRDFYPPDMAVRRHLESVWREVSINHGFEEVDGPTFEHLDLYTVKSGPGIVSELFSFRRAGGDTDYALRPEFTPTLARMVAASAHALPKPIKWFCIPNFFRAERPQRGRLREFFQWNADIVGDDSPAADAEVIALTIGILEGLDLTPNDVRVKISHRGGIARVLLRYGFQGDRLLDAFDLLDSLDKTSLDEFKAKALTLGLSDVQWNDFREWLGLAARANQPVLTMPGAPPEISRFHPQTFDLLELEPLHGELESRGISHWCDYKPSLARGLAYYTGTVFEVHETSGKERAIAGGGRYDNLVELFGGPSTPAVGIAMGDVVIRLMLEERGLLEPAEAYLPRPDLFVIDVTEDQALSAKLIADLRRENLHVRHSYRATKNVGKLLGEAGKTRARLAVILGKELERGVVGLKNLESGEQEEVQLDALLETVRATLHTMKK
jgi:histidyl-tRNA synthetase